MSVSGGDLILASASVARAELLRRAGVDLVQAVAGIDEAAIKQGCRAEGMSADDTALVLAELKAVRAGSGYPGRLVLGADQMLVCEGNWFDKPESTAGAIDQLRCLSGRSHELVSAAVITRDGQRLWHAIGRARLRMRPLSESFLAWYVEAMGERVARCVGAYEIEGLGAQLFESVTGDSFTIQGLPLLAVLAYLREQGMVRT